MSDILEPSALAKSFKPGIYRHYKGGLYHAMFVARSEAERDQEFVIYKSLLKGLIWIRPLALFMGEVEVDGKMQPRFKLVEEEHDLC